MEKTHLPLTKWFPAIYLVGTDKRGYSATGLERELHIGYKSAWYLLQRIRTAMVWSEWDRVLTGTVEVDDVFSGRPTKAVSVGAVRTRPKSSSAYR